MARTFKEISQDFLNACSQGKSKQIEPLVLELQSGNFDINKIISKNKKSFIKLAFSSESLETVRCVAKFKHLFSQKLIEELYIHSVKNQNYYIAADILELPIEISLEVLNYDNGSFLSYACRHDCINIFTNLIDRGADIFNVSSLTGMKMIHYAVHNRKMLEILIDHGADITAVDYSGDTVLHHAVYGCWALQRKSFEAMQFLVNEVGLDISIKNKNGQLAIDRLPTGVFEYERQIIELLSPKCR